MADLSILAGATSQSINVDLYILATGAPQTALVFNSSGLTATYSFTGANTTAVAITLVTLATVTTAYSSGGFKEISSSLMPGLYRLDLPNAAIAAAKGREMIVTITGFSGMATRHIKIELTAVDNQSTAFGLSLAKTTNITGFNDIAATAVVSSGAITTSGGAVSTVSAVTGLTAANLDTTVSSRMATYIQPTGFLAATFPTGTVANTTNITAGTITTTTNLTNAPTAGDFTSTMKTSLNSSTPASVTTVTGNVNGSVGSVTGNVGGVSGVTFPATVASPTNITAGTITTVTNLTNAATAGDFTATMKSSLNAATPTATLSAAYDFAKGTVALTESYASLHSVPTPAQILLEMRAILAENAVVGTTVTTKKIDGSTTAHTYTIDNNPNPTTIVTTT